VEARWRTRDTLSVERVKCVKALPITVSTAYSRPQAGGGSYMITNSWEQAGAFFVSSYLILGTVYLSWRTGAKFWAKH